MFVVFAAMACWGECWGGRAIQGRLLVSLQAASCTLCVRLIVYFSSKGSVNRDPCFVRVANP